MEAKDTVMTIPQLQHLWGNENWQYITSTMTDFFEVVAEAQAELSFKAGIKEVVDYIGDYTKPFPNQREWKAKLKEWGISV